MQSFESYVLLLGVLFRAGFKPDYALLGKMWGPPINFLILMYKNLPRIQRYNCTVYAVLVLSPD